MLIISICLLFLQTSTSNVLAFPTDSHHNMSVSPMFSHFHFLQSNILAESVVFPEPLIPIPHWQVNSLESFVRHNETGTYDFLRNSVIGEMPSQLELPGLKKSAPSSKRVRRTMLNLHQGLGFLTWISWLATGLAGERALSNLRRVNEPIATFLLLQDSQNNLPLYYYLMTTSEWKSTSGGAQHRSLAATTFGLYFVTAGLSVLAPSRFAAVEQGGWDTMFTHKLMAVIHLAAMLSLPSLGERIERQGPGGANSMRAAGWIGFGALSVSIAVFYF